MTDPHPHDSEDLERVIDRTLRGLPPRTAPPRLAARVRAEFARRAALPWWRRSVAEWPAGARAIFVAACVALICLSVLAGAGLSSPVWPLGGAAPGSLAHPLLPWIGSLAALWGAAQDLGRSLASAIPSTWLYGGVAVAFVAYAVLLGSAAVGYRAVRGGH